MSFALPTMDYLNKSIGALPDLKAVMSVVGGPKPECPNMLLPHRPEVCAISLQLRWFDLSSSERILLRFVWEAIYRSPCPLPLFP